MVGVALGTSPRTNVHIDYSRWSNRKEKRKRKMKRFWVSWMSGNYADEGCSAPPLKFWISGSRPRPNNGLSDLSYSIYLKIEDEDAAEEFIEKYARDDVSICAVIDAECEEDVWDLVAKHFPDFETRFCEHVADDYKPGSRFQ